MNNIKIIIFLAITLNFAGCQTNNIEKNSEEPVVNADSKGAYYLDDGPEEKIPENLSSIPDATPKKEPLNKFSNRPYKVFGKTYYPMTTLKPYMATGYATWYGKKYHGNKTSIGEVYNMYEMTAAHKTLPLPCYVKVTNLKNKKTVIVRVNDRGPFVKDRIIDLSYAAADRLEIIEKGSELVKVELINPDNTIKVSNINIYIQAGLFSDEKNANNLIEKIKKLGTVENERIKKIQNDNKFQVLIGPFEDQQIAKNKKDELSENFFINGFIVKR
ncbi:MAG: septal ring lytic transglycosylase RlpA family protein [Nitrosomonadales bacterium]|jgi:rare lipoprotein A|nr:septal ring lytic transglycosylase RlpA family protein [Nitrosomonadales bacterium]